MHLKVLSFAFFTASSALKMKLMLFNYLKFATDHFPEWPEPKLFLHNERLFKINFLFTLACYDVNLSTHVAFDSSTFIFDIFTKFKRVGIVKRQKQWIWSHGYLNMGNSVTSKKSPNVYKSCPKIILTRKIKILRP